MHLLFSVNPDLRADLWSCHHFKQEGYEKHKGYEEETAEASKETQKSLDDCVILIKRNFRD